VDNNQAAKAKDFRNGRACKRNPEVDKAKGHKNRNKAKIRARVEHVLGVVQRLWGFNKAHDRGLVKNARRALSALTNLFMNRKRLMNERLEEKAKLAQKHGPRHEV
jgi:transposase, IS5 family